jgi:hypothetical protein
MAFTLADVAAIEAALSRGELSVQYDNRRVTYRSIEELAAIRDRMIRELGPDVSTTRRPKQVYLVGGKGF